MEHKADRGLFDELPFAAIMADFKSVYGIGETAGAYDAASHEPSDAPRARRDPSRSQANEIGC